MPVFAGDVIKKTRVENDSMKRARWIVAFVLTFVLACALVPGGLSIGDFLKGQTADPANTAYAETVEHVPHEVLAPADSMTHAQEIAKAYGLTLKSYAYGIAVLIAPNAQEAVEKSKEMQEDGIPELSLNLLYTYNIDNPEYSNKRPSDPREYDRENGYLNDEDSGVQVALATGEQWHHEEMDTERAWGEDATGEGVLVAVLDSGIDIDHIAFEDRLSELAYNAETNEIGLEHVRDGFGHGTHVSGIIAASFDDGETSVYGVAPDANILMIKVGDYLIDGSAVLRGINYAIEKGAKIINMSFGRSYDNGNSYDQLEHDHIVKAVKNGITVVVAAGNDSDGHANYPAAYEEAIAVAATRQGYQFDNMYSGSNYGPEIDIAAPGGEIYSTNAPGSEIAGIINDNSDFVLLSGTSMASPNVAGVAALILSKNPGASPADVRAALCSTARDLGELGRDDVFGAGIVNAYAAVLDPDNLLKVTFDFNDGGLREPITLNVVPGNTLFEPIAPEWAGYAFISWLVEETGEAFDFAEAIEDNMKISAQWVEAKPGMYISEFPDRNFRQAVLQLLNDGSGQRRADSFVEDDAEQLAGIQDLYVSNMRIKDMTGLQYFSGLIYLSCDYNQLTELDLSANKELSVVFCDRNNLTRLDVSANTELSVLVCSDNMLTELDVSKNTNLMHLGCYRNSLTELDVTACISLLSLTCDSNRLTKLDVSKNTELESLGCSYNQLTELDVTNNTKLAGEEYPLYDDEGAIIEIFSITVGLDCSGNRLTELDVSKNVNLRVLLCDFNQLTELDVSNNRALTWLLLYENQLTELNLSANIALLVVDCGANLLNEIDVSENTALIELWCAGNTLDALDLSGNDSLKTLVCVENHLTSLDVSGNAKLEFLRCYYNYMESTDKVIGWQTISGLELDVTFIFYPQYTWEAPTGQDITDAFKDPGFLAAVREIVGKPEKPILDYDVIHIRELFLNSWDTPYIISDLAGIEYFKSLEYLYCSEQQITTLDLSNNTMLYQLSCYENQLTELDLSKNVALEYLDCYENNLTELNISNNTKLTWLACGSNNLAELDISNNTELMWLSCYRNDMETLDASNNNALVSLYCFENNLTMLDVSGSPMLVDLNCRGNELDKLDVSSNPLLINLDCSDNGLTGLNVSKNMNLEHLYCYANNLTALDVTNNQNLAVLYCYYNELTMLDLSGCHMLYYLDCANNRMLSPDDVLGWQELGLVLDESFIFYPQDNNDNTSFESALEIAADTPVHIEISQYQMQYYKFTPAASGTYTIESSNWGSGGPCAYLYDADRNELAYGQGWATTGDWNFKIVYELVAGETYYIGATGVFGDGDAEYTLTVVSPEIIEPQTLYGDVNLNGSVTISDVVMLLQYIEGMRELTEQSLINADVNIDGKVDEVDAKLISWYLAEITDSLPYIHMFGDVNLDNNINMADVTLVYQYCRGNISLSGQARLNADVNMDGSVNEADYDLIYSYCRRQIDSLPYLVIDGTTFAEAFPDENFRAKVLQLLNTDGGGRTSKSVMTETDIAALAKITSLDVYSKDIKDMTGLEYFTGLTSLFCNDNKLTVLDVSQNTALKQLNCSGNQLTSLDISNNYNLINLNCSNNQLSELDISSNYELNILDCSDNELTELDVSHNSALTELNCSNNQLSLIEIWYVYDLVKLDCSNNQLTELDMTNNYALTDLNCSNNQLTRLELWNNYELTKLNCSNNQLYTLDIWYCFALEELDCSYNDLVSLETWNNYMLVDLNCSNNLLTWLDVSGNYELTYLDCSNNQLTELFVGSNVKLTYLDCSMNNMQSPDDVVGWQDIGLVLDETFFF